MSEVEFTIRAIEELQDKRPCSEPGCSRPASGGTGRCSKHYRTPSLPPGMVFATRFARDVGLSAGSFNALLARGLIPHQELPWRGLTFRAIDPAIVAPILDRSFCCRCGCGRYTLGKTGYLQGHNPRERHDVEMKCSSCGSIRVARPSQAREGSLCRQCYDRQRRASDNRARWARVADAVPEGYALLRQIAERWGYAVADTHRILKGSTVPEQQIEIDGMTATVYDVAGKPVATTLSGAWAARSSSHCWGPRISTRGGAMRSAYGLPSWVGAGWADRHPR